MPRRVLYPGSSPRMRGALSHERSNHAYLRIIPAYAGSTSAWSPCLSAQRDHPRVCGEHCISHMVTSWPVGSSPRMRGAPHDGRHQTTDTGIIPAYAGSTATAYGTAHGAKDHPRVCGEHRLLIVWACPSTGSSPRMRGARWSLMRGRSISGIIPAYAGST